jgi:ATP-dependent Lon protease
MEDMVVRAVAGFMNAEGGILLLGVMDVGEVSGIEIDLKTLGKKQGHDGFALWLNTLLDNALGPTAASNVRIVFEELPGGTVCRLDVEPGRQPTFARSGRDGADLYVRLNNATRLLNTAEAVEYVRSRWR